MDKKNSSWIAKNLHTILLWALVFVVALAAIVLGLVYALNGLVALGVIIVIVALAWITFSGSFSEAASWIHTLRIWGELLSAREESTVHSSYLGMFAPEDWLAACCSGGNCE